MLELSALWLADPHWQSMDSTARGFHAQLLLLAARQGGRLPDNEAIWRRWLGLPEQGAASPSPILTEALQALHILEPATGNPTGGFAQALDHFWAQRWLPMLKSAWTRTAEGDLTCDLAQRLAGVSAPMPVSALDSSLPLAPKPRKSKKVASSPARLAIQNWDTLVAPRALRGEAWTVLQPLPDKVLELDQIKARWHVPATRSTRLNLWIVGLSVLSTQAGEESKNRGFLASLIKKYGERKVAAAIGEISGRSMPPADPRAFLLGILRRETEGSEAAQRARDLRAGIPL